MITVFLRDFIQFFGRLVYLVRSHLYFDDRVINFANHGIELLVNKSKIVLACRNVDIQITPANVINSFD
ncbi:hypothetical protein D3C73_1485620 [compost metagenome]